MRGFGDMSEEEIEPTDFTCNWGGCGALFDDAQTLDNHVESVHVKGIKNKGTKEKGVVCEWKDCISDKIYRDSWNLVTHLRYKHTHFKPFACTQQGCDKRFVQLHQMKKHSKTPHGPSSRGRGRRERDDGEEESDPRTKPVRSSKRPSLSPGGHVGEWGVGVPSVAGAPLDAPLHHHDSLLGGEEDEARELEAAHALELVRSSPVPPELLQGTQGHMMVVGSAAAPGTGGAGGAGDHLDRSVMVSPTSLLFINTRWHTLPTQRSMAWSPTPFVGTESTGTTPTPPVLDDLNTGPGTPVGAFVPLNLEARPASNIFRPIPSLPKNM